MTGAVAVTIRADDGAGVRAVAWRDHHRKTGFDPCPLGDDVTGARAESSLRMIRWR
jgi:hypothetical protein